jgi:hypothetical protein
VVVNLVSIPSCKTFAKTLDMDSGEGSLILRLKREKYNITKIFVYGNVVFVLPENIL